MFPPFITGIMQKVYGAGFGSFVKVVCKLILSGYQSLPSLLLSIYRLSVFERSLLRAIASQKTCHFKCTLPPEHSTILSYFFAFCFSGSYARNIYRDGRCSDSPSFRLLIASSSSPWPPPCSSSVLPFLSSTQRD